MSVWPFSMRLAPPPVPRSVAIVCKRPGSISCRSTCVPALTEELLEEARDGCLLGLEARDADERAGQVDQLSPINAFQYRARQLVHEGGAGPRSE